MKLSLFAFLMLGCALALAQQAEWSLLIDSGDAAMKARQFSAAEGAYREALAMAEKAWKKDFRVSATLIKLAESCNAQSKKDEAEALAGRSTSNLEEALKAHKPKDSSDELLQTGVAVDILNRSGDLFAANQIFPQAEDSFRRAIVLREKFAADNHPARPDNEDFFRFMAQTSTDASVKLAEADDKLANLYRLEKKFPAAEDLYRKSASIREKRYGPESPMIAESLHNLATCYAQEENYGPAEPVFQRVIAILEKSEFRESPQIATVFENYALLLKKSGRQAEADSFYQRARGIRSQATPTAPVK